MITGVRDKTDILHVWLATEGNNQKVITPNGQQKKFNTSFLSKPASCEVTRFSAPQRRGWAIHQREWSVATFEQLQTLLKELDIENTTTCLGKRECTLCPEITRAKQAIMTIDLTFPLSETGKGLPQYHGHMVLEVHADCHRCAIQEFLAVATEDDLCIALGPKNAHKLGLKGKAIEGLKIFVAGRIES